MIQGFLPAENVRCNEDVNTERPLASHRNLSEHNNERKSSISQFVSRYKYGNVGLDP